MAKAPNLEWDGNATLNVQISSQISINIHRVTSGWFARIAPKIELNLLIIERKEVTERSTFLWGNADIEYVPSSMD